ncbi:hypothetical protein K3495_g14724 [Podosphaera aphanis]|nr:hypothetical protein K3495_g14724 [Podosphaera aphanis]
MLTDWGIITHSICEDRPVLAQLFSPAPKIYQDRYNGLSGCFYPYPIVKGGKAPFQPHNGRDYAIILHAHDIVAEVVMVDVYGAVPCKINRQGWDSIQMKKQSMVSELEHQQFSAP